MLRAEVGSEREQNLKVENGLPKGASLGSQMRGYLRIKQELLRL